jgi:F-type H+-transporting ATPase subunit delta
MNGSKISVRYAKALFALAKEAGLLDPLKKDIELLQQCIHEIPELSDVIHSPVIKASEKTRLFEELFRTSFHTITLSFIKLVLGKRREEYLAGISRYFLALLKKEQGIQPAEVVTAVPLDESTRQSVLKLITRRYNTQVELNEAVDEKLIGGFVLRIGDQQIDASIALKLKRIQNELINSHSS